MAMKKKLQTSALLEYGDYECPHCKAAHPHVKRLRQEFEVDFRNFPVSSVHQHAQRAAEAAEAARVQGKFWQYHDTLFENQDRLEEDDLIYYAKKVGLDMPRFERDMRLKAFELKVKQDYISGVQEGVHGTPTFFVNRERYDGLVSYESLHQALHLAYHKKGMAKGAAVSV